MKPSLNVVIAAWMTGTPFSLNQRSKSPSAPDTAFQIPAIVSISGRMNSVSAALIASPIAGSPSFTNQSNIS